MLNTISYIIFALSVGLTLLGLLTSVRLRKEYQNGFSSALIYFQIFAYTFGFYALWGQVFVDKWLAEYLPVNIMARVITYQALIGLPFMILSWYMMIRFAMLLQMHKVSRAFSAIFFTVAGAGLALLIIIAFDYDSEPRELYIYYYITLGMLSHILTGAIMFLRPVSKTRINRKKLNLLASLVIVSGVLQSSILYFFEVRGYIALVIVVVYFSCYAFIPLILRYHGILDSYIRTGEEEIDFDDFCRHYEISQREKEIIMELYKGRTNKEIADSLFISLQTVKDHTHRIYIKTGMRNRVELVNRIRNM
jgi:DNA-binding CsgD family transcriptional regulator